MDCQVKWVRRLYARHEARYALPASAGMTAKGTRQRLSLKDEEKSLLERKYHNHSRQIHPFRPERISMIAAEIEGALTGGVLLGTSRTCGPEIQADGAKGSRPLPVK